MIVETHRDDTQRQPSARRRGDALRSHLDSAVRGERCRDLDQVACSSRSMTSTQPMSRHSSPKPMGSMRTTRASSEYFFAGSLDRKSTRLNSSHSSISYAVFCLKKKKKKI